MDDFIIEKIANSHTPQLIEIMTFITNIFSPFNLLILTSAIFIILVFLNTHIKAFVFLLAMTSGLLLNTVLKLLFGRERPNFALIEESGYSFPSGHSILATIFFILLAFFFKEKIENKLARALFLAICAIMILLVAFSRVYLRVHYPSDVIAGIALGTAISASAILISKSTFLKAKKTRNKEAKTQ